MIIPTIGRIVWYWPPAPFRNATQAQAAIVAWVHSDTMVNLGVFDSSGTSSPETSVHLWQGEGERPTERFCEWMPYQIGKAKEELHPVKQTFGP
jgi:hypothetical protein